MTSRRRRSRRRFLGEALAAGGGLLGATLLPRRLASSPAILTREAARPSAPYGAAVGDVTGDRAIVWSRSERPARLFVDWSTRESFVDARRVPGPVVLEADGLTARLDLGGLPPGQRIAYRVLFQDLRDPRAWSLPVEGSFRTPAAGRADVRLAFSADTCGQGWGIDEARGGMRLYESMRRASPDLFVHCGDTIYADQPLAAERTLDDGTAWRNLVTPAKSKVAETLDEFRGNHLYNRLDPNLRRFEAEVSQVVIWDDHEVLDNWYPGEVLQDPRFTEKSVSVLAFHEIVAGPAHAGTFGPNALDATFGPEVLFLGIPPGMKPNRPPSDGLQFFGLVQVEGRTGVLRAEIRDRDGTTLHRLELEPERSRRG